MPASFLCSGPLWRPQVRERQLDPWRQQIHEISEYPNVVCKISGLVAYADPERWTAADLRPYVEHVIGCFGWDRVMFGSDWPVCTLAASLKQWVEALSTITRDADEASRKKLSSENARRVYRLAVRALESATHLRGYQGRQPLARLM